MSDQTDTTTRPLTARQRRAVNALVDPDNATIEAAAAAADVPPATLRRWRKLPTFRAELAAAVDELRGDCSRRLHVVAAHAVETLNGAMHGWATGVAVRAAELVLRHVYGERLTVEQTGAVGSYVVECPPRIEDMQEWARRYSPQGILRDAPLGSSNGHGHGPCQVANRHGHDNGHN